MRSILLVGATVLSALAASPVWSQGWSGNLPAVQGQERTLTFELTLPDLVAWNLYLAYSPFTSPSVGAFSTPAVNFDVPFEIATAGLPGAPLPEDFLESIPNGFQEIVVSASGADPVGVNGTLFSVTFSAPLSAQTGPTEVFSRFYYAPNVGDEQIIDLPVLSTNIAAVPEPHAWALMVCGVVAVLGGVARRRKAEAPA